MKKLLLFTVLVCGLSSLGWAGDCKSGCTVGNLEFSNWGLSSNDWAVVPDDMTVEASYGKSGLVTFTFVTTKWDAFAAEGPFPQFMGLDPWSGDITFTVSCADGTNCISGLELPTPEGALAFEDVVFGPSQNFSELLESSGVVTLLPFPVNSVGVDEGVVVGFSSPLYMTAAEQSFDQYASVGSAFVTSTTPEPVSLVLMGSFLGLGALLRRRK